MNHSEEKYSVSILCVILIIKAIILGWFISTHTFGLSPDEAQYWTWSKELAIGYYSKPPAVAWQIAFGTSLFGDTEFGVRFSSLIISFLLSLAVYGLARACHLRIHTALWAAIAMALCPIGIFSSLLATTDGGMVLFWTLGCVIIAHGLSKNTAPNYLLLGICILCGALFKWPIYLLWIPLFFYPRLWNLSLPFGFLLSLGGLLPSFVWNLSHDFATFKHVGTQVAGGASSPGGNFFEFIGAQILFLSPVLFILLILATITFLLHFRRMRASLRFCGATTLVIIGAYSIYSIFTKAQGNWCLFAYPTGIVLLTWYAVEVVSWGRLVLLAGIVLSLILSAFALNFPVFFKHNTGWRELKEVLAQIGYNPKTHFLFGDKYQMTSILSFYSPEQKRAYFLNLKGVRKNQFSYWPGIPKGESGFFVLVEKTPELDNKKIEEYQLLLKNYFQQVKVIGVKALNEKKSALIIECLNYNGETPKDSEVY